MSYTYNVIKNAQTVEYGKFVEIQNDNRFPAISVIRTGNYDSSSAFPGNTGTPTYSAVDVYPKYAVLAYVANTDEFAVTLSAGQVNLDTQQIEYHLSNIDASVSGSNAYLDAIEQNTFDTASATDDTFHEVVHLNTQTSILTTNSYYGTASGIPLYVTSSPQNPSYTILGDSSQLDAFSRLRISQPFSLFDSKTLHDNQSLVYCQTANGDGAINFSTANASIILSTANTGDYAIRQTFTRFPYQPGKSQLALFTGVMSNETNIVKRYGLFTSLTAAPFNPTCGLYFESSNGDMSVWINNVDNGTAITPSQSATRLSWNIDKLNGTGPSGITLNLNAAQIFVIDYEWLGVGRVRFGFAIDGKIYYCHQFNNANTVTAPYMSSPNLPVRAEIRQTGAGSGSMRMICQSVMSEGGQDMAGVTRSIYTGDTGINLDIGMRRALLGVRLQANKLDSVNQILNAHVGVNPAGASNVAHFRWELVLNPTIGGTVPWVNIDNSNLQKFVATGTTNTVTGGTILLAGIGNVGAPIELSNAQFQKFKKLGCSINGVRDELYIVVTPLVNLAINGVWASLTYVDTD